MRSFTNYNTGFTLIEVLISLLIVSLGLLGIAGLEITALRNTQESYWQSVATVQMASILERLRVNHSAFNERQECERWSLQNQFLLPKNKSECVCNNVECKIILTWQKHQLAMQMIKS